MSTSQWVALIGVCAVAGLVTLWFLRERDRPAKVTKFTLDENAAMEEFRAELARHTPNPDNDSARWARALRQLSGAMGDRMPEEMRTAYYEALYEQGRRSR